MKYRTLALVLLSAILLAAVGFAGYRYVNRRAAADCSACGRPIHGGSTAIADVNGQRRQYCCPSCALSVHKQTGLPVRIASLRDYATGEKVEPARAFLVRGSGVNPCAGHAQAPGEHKRLAESHFDRCSPSVLAFSSEETARRFAAEHGGEVIRFAAAAALFH